MFQTATLVSITDKNVRGTTELIRHGELTDKRTGAHCNSGGRPVVTDTWRTPWPTSLPDPSICEQPIQGRQCTEEAVKPPDGPDPRTDSTDI